MRRRLTTATLGMVALLTIAAGCGDDGDSTDTAAPVTSEAVVTSVDETVVDETVVDETMVDDTVDSDGAEGDGSEFCELNDELDSIGGNVFSGNATPEEVQAFFEVEFPATVAQLTAVAPAEIADDIAVSVEGFDLLAERLAANGWDVLTTFNDPALADILNDPKYTEASDAISDYCGT